MLQQYTHTSERKLLSATLRQISHERSYDFVIAVWRAKEEEFDSRVKL